MIAIQRDNLFDQMDQVRQQVLKVPLFRIDEYNQQFGRQEDWPGERSDVLSKADPELNDIIHQAVNQIPMFTGLKFNCFVHYRGADAKDWIHTDVEPLAGIIYINPTNLESGTRLYNDKDCVTDIKYVQNRLIMYSGGYPHQGYGHFGSHKEQGRLTVNLFFDMTDAESQ